jgi:hypothetical protein
MRTDRQTDGHYRANSRFSHFCERAGKENVGQSVFKFFVIFFCVCVFVPRGLAERISYSNNIP